MELHRRSSGTAKAGLATGIVGSSLGALGVLGALGNGASIIGGRTNQPVVVMDSNGYPAGGCCSEDHYVNRYELDLQQSNAAKDAEIALLKANTYNDQKNIEMYKYVDSRFQEFERELARQAVVNQKTADSFEMVAKDVQCCCDRLQVQIDRERDDRMCADNTIITYVNGTFYPIQKADVTTGTTSTAVQTYNPLPSACCNRNKAS